MLTRMTLLAMAASFATIAAAQTETQVPAGDGLAVGEPVSAEPRPGEPYVAETFGDWALRCIVNPEGEDPCRLYQLLSDQNGNAVAEISVFPLAEGGEAVAGATIVTPLETLLTRQITLSVDGGAAKRYPFTFCAEIGCVSRAGFLQEDIDAFRRGSKAELVIVPVAAPDQTVTLEVSLSGFTAGFNAVSEREAN